MVPTSPTSNKTPEPRFQRRIVARFQPNRQLARRESFVLRQQAERDAFELGELETLIRIVEQSDQLYSTLQF